MKPFRCQICGETYLGESRPDRCPFCGAPGRHIISAAEWVDYGIIPMTNPTKDLCLKALDFEVSNSSYYKTCAMKAQTKVNAALFKRLRDQESEHAELIGKMTGIPAPPEHFEDAPVLDDEKFAQAKARELRAILHYQQIVQDAPESRVKEVFAALIDVEGEHLKIANVYS